MITSNNDHYIYIFIVNDIDINSYIENKDNGICVFREIASQGNVKYNMFCVSRDRPSEVIIISNTGVCEKRFLFTIGPPHFKPPTPTEVNVEALAV